MKLAVVLFNLGGPDSPEAVEPFLRNLFSDPAVITLPAWIRRPLAGWIAARRAPVAKAIYDKIGGRSPILEQTEAQARALEQTLWAGGRQARVFVAMRCWHPFGAETAQAVAAWAPDRIVLLPLYPQFSTTTSASSLEDWRKAAGAAGIACPTCGICCYFCQQGYVAAQARLVRETLAKRKDGIAYRLLLSAHGLPKRIVDQGDPYQWQIEQSAAAIVAALASELSDWRVCYQSRVGPLQWLEPSTVEEIRRAGRDGLGVIVAPIAFVSEHSETLVELDIEYAKEAAQAQVPDFLRVPTVGTAREFIDGLAQLVIEACHDRDSQGRRCPSEFVQCGYLENWE